MKMASIDTVYVLGGGEYLMQVFNGVAAIVGSSSWESMFRIALLISAASFFVVYLRGHDPKEVIKFAAYIILVSSVLLGPKRSVQIIDRTDPTGVYLVDNVPLGLAAPAHMISSIGTSLTELYESIFHMPDSLSYSKTGMLFGANLVGNVSDVMSTDGDIAELMSLYTKNCVIGDILINHKYSFQELMNSRDPYTLIFQKPSPLRGVMVPEGNKKAQPAGFWTCEDLAKRVLMPAIGADTQTGGETWAYAVRRIFGGRPDANVLFSAMLGDSYNYYYSGSETASQLMRNSVVMNALKQGIAGYSAQSGDTASLVNLASTSSYNKMRLSWATSTTVATNFTPLLYTILFSLIVALFPIFILLMTVHALTTRMLFNYIMSIIYLQSWAPMFAILNHATSFYLRGQTNGLDFNLANQAHIQQIHSDIGLIAGWLTLSIPFIAMAIVKGLGPAVAQAGNYLGTAINSSASASSSQAADGTWAFNNMQTDNVAGNKWDTNSSFRDGQMTRQLASGAMNTVTSGGQEIMDTSGAMSRLPVSIKGSEAMVSSLQQSAKHAQATAAQAMSAFQSSVNVATNQLAQFSKNFGNSATVSAMTDSGISSNQSEGYRKIKNAVDSQRKADNSTTEEALSKLFSNSVDFSKTAGAKAEGGFSLPVFGGVQGYLDSNARNTDSTQNSTQERGARNQDAGSEESAQRTREFNEGLELLNSSKISDGTNSHDNEASSEISQLSVTLNTAKNQYEQYSRSTTESQEYSDMASYVTNNSAQIDSNLDQEFANYVRQAVPSRADAILSNTSDLAIAREREALAKDFINDRLLPNVKNDYAQNRASIVAMDKTASAGNIPSGESLMAEYDGHVQDVNTLSQNAGIKHDTAQKVTEKEKEYQDKIGTVKGKINEGAVGIQRRHDELKLNHQEKIQEHEVKMEKEREKHMDAGLITDTRRVEKTPDSNGLMSKEKYYKKNSD
ncbi:MULTISPECIES: conjugal transfer mating-pair stabilization protein TraG [Providencia]|uniref:TraG N-terminal Proteobacteria domain-containing protein n=1 Tax=Providencia rettgeri TaxID=587 RepID=A0A264VMX7_PRORE|nr:MULTISPECIES: conjugal transfer mating-pair stabilization protein TraG [Providencia]ELR5076339.1 conjugal transfer mating pair stabilization protein TraG [Providencia rettgeri]MBQ0211536.1 conjugal transfer mating pair stabilization protein TraG [Providencia rettgeri]MBQ0266339.1 conjugal transfer mating pair stabilization protein TraG [Providencia rettgeri]MBQ0399351.1 conjugal transfer mating pair stabilization protein TraG [Providencia rettgeri]MDR9616784.1 conjugal transfer mating-pair 